MHHFITEVIFLIFLAALVVAAGWGIVSPMVDRIPPARLRAVAIFWLALFLLAPLGWSALDAYLWDKHYSYLYELGHEWVVYTMFLSGLAVSQVRRWRRRAR